MFTRTRLLLGAYFVTKWYEVKRLRYQFWPYKGETFGAKKYYADMPGGRGACVWSSINVRRDVTVDGTLEVWPSVESWGKGRFKGWNVFFFPAGGDQWFYSREFGSWATHGHSEEARAVLEYMKGKRDWTDFYFEELRQGGMEEDELFAWYKTLGIPATTGRVVCRWAEADIPDAFLSFTKQLAAGAKIEDVFRQIKAEDPGDNEQLAPMEEVPLEARLKSPKKKEPRPTDRQAVLQF